MKSYTTKDPGKIRNALEKSLSEKRYEHTLGVTYTATALAMRYGADMEAAYLAGLLHDCAKEISDKKALAFCKKHMIPISESESENPSLLHAKIGSYMARNTYHIEDCDILNAIANHTTGRPQMSLLEKIIFIADYIEPGRNKASNLDNIRKTAFIDLDDALLQILSDTLAYLGKKVKSIDPMTEKTYRFYFENVKPKRPIQ